MSAGRLRDHPAPRDFELWQKRPTSLPPNIGRPQPKFGVRPTGSGGINLRGELRVGERLDQLAERLDRSVPARSKWEEREEQ